MTPTHQGYRRPARWLHWIMAALVLLMIPAGLIMVQKGLARPVQDALYLFHKNTGVILLGLLVIRLIHRRRHPAPDLPATLPHWQRRAAHLSHMALYVLLLVMPVSGYIRVRAGGFPIEGLDAIGIGTLVPKSENLANAASAVHQAAAFLLIALIALHVAAALQHAMLRRDGVWSRMWPPNG